MMTTTNNIAVRLSEVEQELDVAEEAQAEILAEGRAGFGPAFCLWQYCPESASEVAKLRQERDWLLRALGL